MHARRSLVALAVAICAATPEALAQQSVPSLRDGTTLTLADALAAARRHVPNVLAAIGQARVARGQIALARAPLLPVVGATGTAQAYGQDLHPIGGSMVPCAPGTPCFSAGGMFGYAFADASLSVRWMIWDFGRTSLQVDAARRGAESAQAEVRAAERLAMLTAANAYFLLLADRQLVAASEQTLSQRRREYEIAQSRVAVGSDPEIVRTRAEIAVATAELDLQTARATVANDAAALASALGFDPVHPPNVVQPQDVAVDDDPERAAAAAMAARPEVTAARMTVASAEASVAAARAAWRPSLTTNGSGGARYTEYSSGTAAISEIAMANVVFAVPLFDPVIPANVRIAEGNLAVARASLDEQLLAVRTDAVQAALAVRAAREQLASAEHNATLAAANLALAEGRFQVGTAPMLELVDAQAQEVNARITVIQRRFQFEAAKVRLLAAEERLGR